jgi:CBS domain-containing protein
VIEMEVKEIMTKDVIFVDKDVDLKYVLRLMKKHNITKIPVVEEKKLIGVITDNQIAVKLGSIRKRGVPAARLHASSVMEKNIEIISPDTEIKTILKTVGEPGPTMLNVVDDGKLIGVITKADLLSLVDCKKKVKEIMHKNIHSVSPEDRVIHARRKMIDENIARLPVINNGTLLGIISDNEVVFALSEIKRSFPLGKQKHRLEELLVNDVMKTQVIWIDLEITIEDAAKIMLEKNVGSLIIMDNSKIAGIITRTDLLRTINS